jgi:hypothetical protein
MLRIDLINDENLTSVLDHFISGMLPHDKFDPTLFGGLLRKSLSYVHLEEMSMEYFAMFSLLAQFNKMQVSLEGFVPRVGKDEFEQVIKINIWDLCRTPEVGMKEFLDSEGIPSNLEVETNLNDAAQRLHSRCMELYDRCFELEIGSDEASSVMPAYEAAFLSNVAETAMNTQRDIILNKVRIGRKVYIGVHDWLEYVRHLAIEVDKRLNESDDNVLHVNSLEVSDKLFKDLAAQYEPLGFYEIPPLDDETPMLKHRFVVDVGMEGVGKTNTMIKRISNMLINKVPVVVMVGETTQNQMYAQIISSYIFKKYKLFVTRKHIAGVLDCPDNIKQIIALTKVELFESGLVTLVGSFGYTTIYQELKEIYDVRPFGAAFIDHSRALKGQGNETELIGIMSFWLREFKKHYPVFINVLSHPSAAALEFLKKSKKVTAASPTAASSTLSREADEVFIWIKDENLEKQNLVGVQVFKRRGPVISSLIVLKVIPEVYQYEYDVKYQSVADSNTMSAEAQLKEIEGRYNSEDDDGFDDELVDEDGRGFEYV